MDYQCLPVFQRQVVRDAKYLFSTSIDTIDVMKKQPEQGGHPNGNSILSALMRTKSSTANMPLDLEKTRCSNPKAMQLEAEVGFSQKAPVMIRSLDDGMIGQFISRAAFNLVRFTSFSSKLKRQLFVNILTVGSIVSQNTSWSCLNVSLESFRNIVNIHNFSDDVYDVVQAFRRRTSNLQQFRWSACRARLSSPEGGRYGQSLADLMTSCPPVYEFGRDLL